MDFCLDFHLAMISIPQRDLGGSPHTSEWYHPVHSRHSSLTLPASVLWQRVEIISALPSMCLHSITLINWRTKGNPWSLRGIVCQKFWPHSPAICPLTCSVNFCHKMMHPLSENLVTRFTHDVSLISQDLPQQPLATCWRSSLGGNINLLVGWHLKLERELQLCNALIYDQIPTKQML